MISMCFLLIPHVQKITATRNFKPNYCEAIFKFLVASVKVPHQF
jgi:hypothetical protein